MKNKSFTLIELLVVIAIIMILASMLMPVLEQARNGGYKVACLNNLKQMHLAHTMYTADNNKYFMNPNTSANVNNNHWVALADSLDALKKGKMFDYVNHPDSYYCDADEIHLFRSYSINNAIGGTNNYGSTIAVRKRNKVTEGPSEVYVILEESDPRGTNYNSFFVNPSTFRTWVHADWPAVYHINSYSVTFLDGHAKTVRMTPYSVDASLANQNGITIPASNVDRIKLYAWQNVK
jgi:type II secretory pathway pseudopilin PulG